jgi:5'-3' exonuclease
MKTLIIDGNNLIHRTWWTAKNQAKRSADVNLPNLHIYFTLNAIYSYVNKYKPDKTITVWDEKIDYQVNVRKTEFAGYKGNRTKDSTPHENNDAIKAMLSYLNVPSIFPRELEADDIVAYICKNTTGHKVIVSVDQDFLQLVNDETILFDPIRKKEFTYNRFEELTGYTREDWMTVKCLKGDKSDNVPGIPGFGKVRVQKYLDGNIVLDVEQQQTFNTNLSLFSLDKIEEMVDESKYYQDQLDAPIVSDWGRFIEECKQYDFHRILNNQETWHTLFLLGNRLQSILG